MKTIKSIILTVVAVVGIAALINSCAVSKSTADKTGSQLWSENCGRCHNAPPISTYSSDQWEVLGLHMKTRTMIPDDQIQKIIVFLKAE